MKLKSSKKHNYYLIAVLAFVVIILFSFKTIFAKGSKYVATPDFEQKTTFDFIQISFKEKHYKKLKEKRNKAISVGILEVNDDDYVPATIKFNSKEYKADIRLKGDWTDHLVGEKWSFRVKLKGDQTILGMRKFSIHTPRARGYINEWLFHKAVKKEDLIGLRYGFLEGAIHVKLKNSSKYVSNNVGIYAIEETFDKRTIENNKRKESVILKFSEDYFWNEVKNRIAVGYDNGQNWNKFIDPQFDFNQNLPITAFSESKVIADSTMNAYFKLSKNLLEDVRQGIKSLDEVFDIKELALQNAILNLFGGTHGTYIINLRFYYNPITSKLEPVAFDANSGTKLKKYEHFMFLDRKKDSTYLKELAYALAKVSQKDYLDELNNKHKEVIQEYSKEIKKEFDVKGIAIQNLRYNQDILKNELERLKSKYNLDIVTDSDEEINEIELKPFTTPKVADWSNQSTILKASDLKYKSKSVYTLERQTANKPSYSVIPNNRVKYGDSYELSVIVKKKAVGSHFGLRLQGVYPNRTDALFNLEKGKVKGSSSRGNFESGNAKIMALGNDWYRCSLITKNIKTDNVKIIFGPTNNIKKSFNWEGGIDENSSVFIVPSSLDLKPNI